VAISLLILASILLSSFWPGGRLHRLHDMVVTAMFVATFLVVAFGYGAILTGLFRPGEAHSDATNSNSFSPLTYVTTGRLVMAPYADMSVLCSRDGQALPPQSAI
jgi:Na+-driven multidrug efflux pump